VAFGIPEVYFHGEEIPWSSWIREEGKRNILIIECLDCFCSLSGIERVIGEVLLHLRSVT
jgi:hypothetical protein